MASFGNVTIGFEEEHLARLERVAAIMDRYTRQGEQVAHTVDEDFEHFLTYSGFGQTETPETIAKLKQAFEAAW